jgi:hypothetical protein
VSRACSGSPILLLDARFVSSPSHVRSLAGVVGAHAGELILPWVLAIGKGHRIGDMASLVAPYPTLSEISKRAAGSYFTPALFSARTRRLVRLLGAFG